MKKQCVQCEVGTTYENIIRKKNYAVPVPGFSLLVANSLPRRLGFDPGPINARFIVDKMTQRRNYLRAYLLLCFFVRVFPPSHHTHLHNNVALVRCRNGRNLGTKQSSVGCRGALNRKLLSYCYCSCLKGYEISKGRE
jgi:hypothetical protein